MSSRNVDSPPCSTTISEPKSQVLLGLSPLGWLMVQQGLQIYVLQLVKHGSKTSSNLQPSIYANINPMWIHRDQCDHTLRKTEHFETLVTGSTLPPLNHLQWSWPHLSSQLKLNLLSHYFSWVSASPELMTRDWQQGREGPGECREYYHHGGNF